jgi:hypothetical protein
MAAALHVDLEKGTRTFFFQLLHRTLDLGSTGSIQYYWMDSRQFRRRSLGPNYRSCVDSWWADVEHAGETHLLENRINLVLAEAFPLVNTARSLQDIYRDAHLHEQADREFLTDPDSGRPEASRRTYSLPEDETRRLLALARGRDGALVRAELESLFLGTLPAPTELLPFQRALRAWVDNGIVAHQKGGRDALHSYLHTELRPWLNRFRRRGRDDRTRLFINMFSYECKVAFYLCYANAWIGLIPRLVHQHRLDPLSERFLRIWHHQNQPIEDPDAPTGGHRDVFCGQVLALHPLSGIILSEPDHRQAIGGWIGHPDFDALHQQGRIGTCPAYWDMVAAILIAAHEYAHSHRRWDATRRGREIGSPTGQPEPARDQATASFSLLFEDYVRAHSIACPQCQAPLSYARHQPPAAGDSEVRVVFHCRDRGHELTLAIHEDDLRDQLESS